MVMEQGTDCHFWHFNAMRALIEVDLTCPLKATGAVVEC